VHFAHAGHALLGDRKYAKKPWSEIFARPALHSYELEMPEGGPFQAPLPLDLRQLLEKLGAK
jgi:23S rRNA-/tRNA-specific pseudouridylate synthase